MKTTHTSWVKYILLIAFLVLPTISQAVISQKSEDLRDKMRELWIDHVVWTREFIVAFAAGSLSQPVASERLLHNQEEIGQAVAGFYGAQAGEKLTALLKDHILISVEVVTAAKAGNDAQLKIADKKWHDNADQIASFLSGANPAWPKAEMQKMMYDHLAKTTKEAVARLKGNWKEEVAIYDDVRAQIIRMADMLSDGIIKQFPAKF